MYIKRGSMWQVLYKVRTQLLVGMALMLSVLLIILLATPITPSNKHKVATQMQGVAAYDQQCNQFPVLSSMLDKLQVQQQLVSRKGKNLPSHVADVVICRMFTHDYDSCQPVAVPNIPPEQLPLGFNWKSYARYYPDVMPEGEGQWLLSENTVVKHYLEVGNFERRIARKLNVVIRYVATSGLINQQYAHICALVLATVTGAKLVMPNALVRDSFDKEFNLDQTKNKMDWNPVDLSQIIDTKYLQEYWSKRGLKIETSGPWQKMPELKDGEVSYVEDLYPGMEERQHVRIVNFFRRPLNILDMVNMIQTEVLVRAQRLQQERAGDCIQNIVVDLPCPFFALKTQSAGPLVAEVAKSLKFNPRIQKMAHQIKQKIQNQYGDYNGAHFRIETDAEPWMASTDGREGLIRMYTTKMQKQDFDATTILYLSSALLTYDAGKKTFADLSRTIIGQGLAKKVVSKEDFVPKQELAQFSPELQALVDLLVLLECKTFVGLSVSTFSFYIKEYRSILGKDDSHLVTIPIIGTETMFNDAATLEANIK
eukprot:TRINITY_DN4910_c0_g1_i1.p1 TRINITY_DN4910_c0_g1~~TRINITY_DN4910_c0_g1_i1.p1  ORF type:complete len:539 (-),score=49.49 TRINITY_DN4910_c0_g1_i1:945-2561(-)